MGESSRVPAVTQALGILTFLASRPGPVPAATIAREVSLPRSTTYHLLAVLAESGFVTHLPEERAYGLGVVAFEIGSAYLRNDPLERLARPLLVPLVERADATAHLGVLHGAETLYVLKIQSPKPVALVTDVGVRLPAHLTAVGRAMLAHLPPAQLRALYPGAASFVDRTGLGPTTPTALRRLLRDERHRGWFEEDGFVTEGIASVAACAFDHTGRPAAAVGVTFRSSERSPQQRAAMAAHVQSTADALTRRLCGHRPFTKSALEAATTVP
jgi:DNA-binding IclR family transcriptional regulator